MKMIIIQVVVCMMLSVSSVLFGMESNKCKKISPHIPQGNLYSQCAWDTYASLNKNGTFSQTKIFHVEELKPLYTLRADIIKTENNNYCLKAKVPCGCCTTSPGRYGVDTCIELGDWVFLLPIDLTQEQLIMIKHIRKQGPFARNVFAFDDAGSRFCIDDVLCEVDLCSLNKEVVIPMPSSEKYNIGNNGNTMWLNCLRFALGCCFGVSQALLRDIYPGFTKHTT